MNLERMSELIAKQLNDHSSSPRGAVQPTYYTWTKHHIHDAIQQGLSYLYAIKPDVFASPACFKVEDETCLVDLREHCCNVLSILGIGSTCDNVSEQEKNTNSLLPLLKTTCDSTSDNPSMDTYSYQFRGEGIVQFAEPVPANTLIHFICASPPASADDIPDCILAEYQPLIVPFALWFILLTDNESRSNQPRWESYYAQVRDFVQLKLSLEFSLRASDYIDGRQIAERDR